MGLLHKNLILAGIASVAMVGFLGSSSASALDGFSFSDVINNYRNQTEQPQSYLTNPFGTSTDCEVANPDSAISCNKSSFPSLLFNEGEVDSDIWGHDGKGNIFTDANKYINNDPRLIAAAKGDELHFSLVINSKRYLAGDATDPVKSYSLAAILSPGLDFDASTIELEIDGETVPDDAYVTHAEDASSMVAGAKIIGVEIAWRNDDFIYPENAVIEMRYSATVNDEATGEVYSNGICAIRTENNKNQIYPSGDPYTSSEYRATAMLDGNILIRRVDANGNPLAGAKYLITDVNAVKNTDGTYQYAEDGDINLFETNENGFVVIRNVPFGEYAITESETPAGHEPEQSQIVKVVGAETAANVTYAIEDIFKLPNFYGYSENLRPLMDRFDGEWGMLDGGTEELVYDDASGKYIQNNGRTDYSVRKEGGNYYASIDGLEIKLTYDAGNDRFYGFSEFADYFLADGSFDSSSTAHKLTFNDENTVTVGYLLSEDVTIFERRPGGECFYGDVSEVFSSSSFDVTDEARLCPDGDVYQLVIPANTRGEDINVGYRYVYRDAAGGYVASVPFVIPVFSLKDETSGTLAPYVWFGYYEREDMYFMLGSPGIIQVQLNHSVENKTLFATKFLFRDRVSGAAPEDIPNPQTSDAILLVAMATLGAMSLGCIAARRNTRR